MKSNVNVPVIALGGAGHIDDIKNIFKISKIDAVACGSLFVYHGPLKGILINYPSREKIEKIIGEF
jgi:cyclase